MSISPAQMSLQIAYAEGSGESRSAGSAASPQGAAASPPDPASSASAAASASSASVTADLRIDNQHKFYYEFVDGSTGNVVFEIPPEALRAIGESLNLPLNGEPTPHSLDVKS